MENIWWSKVPNAWALVNHVSESLLNEKNILLHCKHRMPWRNEFVRTVKETIQENNSSKSFEVVQNVVEPGPYLLKNHCKLEKRAEYRPTKGYACFFAESDDVIVHDKYFWVMAKSIEEINAWINFVTEYYKRRPKEKNSAVFILEYVGRDTPQRRKGLELVSFEEYINDYDKTVFATLLTSELKEPAFLKNYLTELMASFAGTDIELMAELIYHYKELISKPHEALTGIVDEFQRSDGSMITASPEKTEVEHFVWKAQIKVLYPQIEEFRKRFVEKFASSIESGLPIEASDGETIVNPEAVELGGLVFLAGTKALHLSDKDYNQLVQFRDARNTLSHLGVLSWSKIEELFM